MSTITGTVLSAGSIKGTVCQNIGNSSVKELIFDEKSKFPTVGDPYSLYIDSNENKIYRYDEKNSEYIILCDNFSGADTLKELSDWITEHEDSAAAMNTAIKENKDNIAELDKSKANAADFSNVGNYKAVSVEVNQGLSDKEKKNARDNIDASDKEETPLLAETTETTLETSKGTGLLSDWTKNYLPAVNSSAMTAGGVTCTPNSDGSFTINGITDSTIDFNFDINFKLTKKLYFKVSGNAYVFLYDSNWDYKTRIDNASGNPNAPYEANNIVYKKLQIRLKANTTYTNAKIKPYLTETANSEFVPHEYDIAVTDEASSESQTIHITSETNSPIPFKTYDGITNIVSPSYTKVVLPKNNLGEAILSKISFYADKLTTARKINGAAFDGSADINVRARLKSCVVYHDGSKQWHKVATWKLNLNWSTHNITMLIQSDDLGHGFSGIARISTRVGDPSSTHNSWRFYWILKPTNANVQDESFVITRKSSSDAMSYELWVKMPIAYQCYSFHILGETTLNSVPVVNSGVTLYSKSGNGDAADYPTGDAALAITSAALENPPMIPYGVCATQSDTAAKKVSVPNFKLVVGARVTVKFINGAVSSSPVTLNVSETGAKTIAVEGDVIDRYFQCKTNQVCDFVYDGAYWNVI